MIDNKNKLSAHQRKLYDVFDGTEGRDVSVSALYNAVYGENSQTELFPDVSNRAKQQQLGPLINRINKKLEGEAIKPGRLKQTYRLVHPQTKVS